MQHGAILAAIALSVTFSINSLPKSATATDPVTGVMIISHWGMLQPAMEWPEQRAYPDTVSVYFMGAYNVCRMKPVWNSQPISRAYGTEPYLIYRRGEKTGLLFEQLNDLTCVRVNVDSILSLQGLITGGNSLGCTDWEKSAYYVADTLVEKYLAPANQAVECPDSVIVYYAKGMDVPFKLSDLNDSAQRKLFKLRVIFAGYFHQSTNTHYPEWEIRTEMQVTRKRAEDIERIFDRFSKGSYKVVND